ncbi:hypothetical protein [Lyngbya sp. CCY1209]|uniref:hypothetical protein n=1 Tax=Lyngbya sp. CCY1209 TaxID=2886103 RepID=UPI002D20BB00|nr:hypothetical protein [Lyngbya sp. CCY1209]MEB3882316.1 hypothetical protein [Lyngbya sp. CCY1209]
MVRSQKIGRGGSRSEFDSADPFRQASFRQASRVTVILIKGSAHAIAPVVGSLYLPDRAIAFQIDIFRN